ncbi:MAG: zf-TFIIB domain-containing protein [Pseudomonadota bacterium]
MKCPVCKDANLAMTERQGIEIDYCPQCRGIWLDRGELDRLIERAAREDAQRELPPAAADAGCSPRRAEHDRGRERHYDDERYRRRRKSFLGELFDFD